jgi:transcriptional regulator with XRE-family HTH domain
MTNRIRELRERARLTQRELAILADADEADISRWETGGRSLTPGVIDRLARVFKVESWELFLDQKGLRQLAGTPGRAGSATPSKKQGKADAAEGPQRACING